MIQIFYAKNTFCNQFSTFKSSTIFRQSKSNDSTQLKHYVRHTKKRSHIAQVESDLLEVRTHLAYIGHANKSQTNLDTRRFKIINRL